MLVSANKKGSSAQSVGCSIGTSLRGSITAGTYCGNPMMMQPDAIEMAQFRRHRESWPYE